MSKIGIKCPENPKFNTTPQPLPVISHFSNGNPVDNYREEGGRDGEREGGKERVRVKMRLGRREGQHQRTARVVSEKLGIH